MPAPSWSTVLPCTFLIMGWPEAWGSCTNEGSDQRVGADLPAPVAVHGGIEGGAGRQRVGREEVLAGAKYQRRAVLQADLHLPAQDEHPLRIGAAVELAAKANRAVAQLQAAAGHQRRQHRGGVAFGQRDRKSTRLNSSHSQISYAVFCLKK